ncbi:Trihelix transcription factor ASR3 [Linum perenne]
MAPEWTVNEERILVNAIVSIEGDWQPTAFSSSFEKWKILEAKCTASGVRRNLYQFRAKWTSLLSDYNLIKQWNSNAGEGRDLYWYLESETREQFGLPERFDDQLFNSIDDYFRSRSWEMGTDLKISQEAEVELFDMNVVASPEESSKQTFLPESDSMLDSLLIQESRMPELSSIAVPVQVEFPLQDLAEDLYHQGTNLEEMHHQTEYNLNIEETHQQTEYNPDLEVAHQTQYNADIEGTHHETEYNPDLEVAHQTEYKADLEGPHQTDYIPHLEETHQTDYIPHLEETHQTDYIPHLEGTHQTEYIPDLEGTHQTEYNADLEETCQVFFTEAHQESDHVEQSLQRTHEEEEEDEEEEGSQKYERSQAMKCSLGEQRRHKRGRKPKALVEEEKMAEEVYDKAQLMLAITEGGDLPLKHVGQRADELTECLTRIVDALKRYPYLVQKYS